MLKKAYINVPALFVVFCIMSVSSLAQTGGRKCWIKTMVGDVKVQRSKSPKWIKARVRMPLKENDAIRTFVESEAVIQTSEGSEISLKENTTIELSSFSKSTKGAKKTGMKILSGDLLANVKKLVNKKSKFEFETPTAVAAIRGTRVGFDVEKDKTDIKVYEGKVYVVPKGARKGAELKSNEMTSVVKGQKKIVVQALKETEEEEESKRTVTDTADTAGEVRLVLKVFSPENGQVIMPGEQVTVAGKVSPIKAVVRIRGTAIKVSPAGEFRRTLKAPTEEGEYSVDIEAVYKEESKTITRHFIVRAMAVDFSLVINEPKEGQVISKPLIKVSGFLEVKATVDLSKAEVSIMGSSVPVSPDGKFTKEIPLPDEEGEFVVEIEAVLNDKTKTESRTVIYRAPEEDISIVINYPTEKQVVCDNVRVKVDGFVKPITVEEISVNGMDIRVGGDGKFQGFARIPEDPGEHEIEFEASKGDKSKTVRRVVVFEPTGAKCNKEIPRISPTVLPPYSKTSKWSFTVLDDTPFDELTVYTSIDGMKDSETGMPKSQFYLELEEGIHYYEIYAQDLAKNTSNRVSGKLGYVLARPEIRLRNPSGTYHVIHIPPSNPDEDFRPEFTLEFSVENLPDDNPKLLREIQVRNESSGDTKSLKNFTTDIDFDFDIELKRGENKINIKVRDINDRDTYKQCTILVK